MSVPIDVKLSRVIFEFSVDASRALANENRVCEYHGIYLYRLEVSYKVARDMSRVCVCVCVAINRVIERDPSLLRTLSECNLIS